MNFLKLDMKFHMFVHFFSPQLGECVCICDGIFKGAQDSLKKVKDDSLVGKISCSHETATTRQEVSC